MKVFGKESFYGSGVRSIVIPDSVCELCDECFCDCQYLYEVSFSPSSSVERLGAKALCQTSLHEITIPDSVREIGDRCFDDCGFLCNVSFGKASCLHSIGNSAFSGTLIIEIFLPNSLSVIGDHCFYDSRWLLHVHLGQDSSIEHVGAHALDGTQAVMLIPDSDRIRSLLDACGIKWRSISSTTGATMRSDSTEIAQHPSPGQPSVDSESV